MSARSDNDSRVSRTPDNYCETIILPHLFFCEVNYSALLHPLESRWMSTLVVRGGGGTDHSGRAIAGTHSRSTPRFYSVCALCCKSLHMLRADCRMRQRKSGFVDVNWSRNDNGFDCNMLQ